MKEQPANIILWLPSLGFLCFTAAEYADYQLNKFVPQSVIDRCKSRRQAASRILAKELEARGWTVEELSEAVGYPMAGVVNGDYPITPDIAQALERVWGTSANLWVDLASPAGRRNQ